MTSDPFAEIRDHLHAAVNDAIAGLDYSHSQLLGQEISRLSHDPNAFLPALLCVLTAETLGAGRDAALAGGTALALLEASAYVVDDLVLAGNEPVAAAQGLIGPWGVPRTLNAADGFFALAHESLLALEEQGFEAETVLSLAAELDAGGQTWAEECESRFADGQKITSHPSPALLFAAGCLGSRLGGLDVAESGHLGEALAALSPDRVAAAAITTSAIAALSGAATYLAGVARE